MNCTYCGLPVVLMPSAAERAEKFGGTAKDYKRLFPIHADCLIKKRNEETSDLLKKLEEIRRGGPWKVCAKYPDPHGQYPDGSIMMGVGFPTKEACQEACDELKAGKNGQEGAIYEPRFDYKWSNV